MAISMSISKTLSVITDLFGAGSDTAKKIEYLASKGVKVTMGLFTFSIDVGGTVFSEHLPTLVNKAASGNDLMKQVSKQKIADVVESALVHFHTASAIDLVSSAGTSPGVVEIEVKPSAPAPDWMTKAGPTPKEIQAKMMEEFAASQQPVAAEVSKPTPTKKAHTAPVAEPQPVVSKPKPVPDVIPLAKARALGQKVNGTSGGSVYRACAIGKLNVAVRIASGAISVRAEFQGSRDDAVATRLSKLGFSDHQKYLSMHMQGAGSGLTMRVIGSLVLGMETEFEQVATTEGQINA